MNEKVEDNKKQQKKVVWVSLATIGAVFAVILVIVAIVNVNMPQFEVCRGETGDALNSCLNKESVSAYEKGGVQAVLDIYDNYISLAKNDAEKRDYTIYKAEGLNEVCNYDCQQDIRDTVDSLMGLEENDDSIATICVLGTFYSRNSKYEEYCKKNEATATGSRDAELDTDMADDGEGNEE